VVLYRNCRSIVATTATPGVLQRWCSAHRLHWENMRERVWWGMAALSVSFIDWRAGRKGVKRGCAWQQWWIFNASASIDGWEGRRRGLRFRRGGRCSSVEGRLVCDTTSVVRRWWRVERWEMTWLGQMVGRMRYYVYYAFQNYFLMEKDDMTCTYMLRD
jgi:hypothetical protein